MRKLLFVLIFSASLLAQTDKYGGLTGKPCAGGVTGSWYVEQSSIRSLLCDPLGNGMWMKATYVTDPGALTNVATKYGSSVTWASATASRLKSWGFNTIAPYSSDYILPWATDNSYPVDTNGIRSIPTKLPVIYVLRPGYYGMNLNTSAIGTSITVGIKDIANAPSPRWGGYQPANGVPDWYDSRYLTVLDYMLNTDPRAGMLPSLKTNPDIDYMLGLAVEDSDQTWCLGSGEAFDTQPAGHQQWHCSWLTATMSPIQQVHPTKGLIYGSDTTVYMKTAWRDWLIAKYSTIAALNTAWGSSYTSFNTTASNVTSESFATTDGTNYQFTHTLANSGNIVPNSIRVFDGGTLIGGDCYHPNSGDTCNQGGGTSKGGIWGPTIAGGYVNYGTKSATISYATAPVPWVNVSRTSNVCELTFHFWDNPPSFTVGDKINVTSNTVCGGSALVLTYVSGDGYTIRYAQTGANQSLTDNSYPWGTVSKLVIPASGHVLTVTYQVNGWNAGGTGLMDENGSNVWMGTDITALSNTAPAVAADMRSFLYQTAYDLFTQSRTKVKTAFPKTLYVGPDSMGTWGVPPRKEVLQAAKDANMDFAIMGGSQDGFTQPMIDFVQQWYGKPVTLATFNLANADSPYSSNSAATGTVATQAIRGSQFLAQVNAALNNTATTTGKNPWLGYWWWQYTDNPSEIDNWGLVTVKDNAYDGYETSISSHACAAPLTAYTCGGEAANYGDVLTGVKSANTAIDTALSGGGTITLPGTGSVVKGGNHKGGKVK